jgi:hypothetical protein
MTQLPGYFVTIVVQVSAWNDTRVGARRLVAVAALIVVAGVAVGAGVVINIIDGPGWLKVVAGILAVLVPLAALGPRLSAPPGRPDDAKEIAPTRDETRDSTWTDR